MSNENGTFKMEDVIKAISEFREEVNSSLTNFRAEVNSNLGDFRAEVNSRLGNIEGRLNTLEPLVHETHSRIGTAKLEGSVHKNLADLSEKVDHLSERVDDLSKKTDHLSEKVDHLSQELSNFKGEMRTSFSEQSEQTEALRSQTLADYKSFKRWFRDLEGRVSLLEKERKAS